MLGIYHRQFDAGEPLRPPVARDMRVELSVLFRLAPPPPK
jgi:hypothetical protein